jgi:hypothetical protein
MRRSSDNKLELVWSRVNEELAIFVDLEGNRVNLFLLEEILAPVLILRSASCYPASVRPGSSIALKRKDVALISNPSP